MIPERNTTIAARLWWWLLPYAGGYGYGKDEIPAENWRWWMRFDVLPYWLWRLVGRLPSSAPFKPMPEIVCNCDYCRGVPGARFKP